MCRSKRIQKIDVPPPLVNENSDSDPEIMDSYFLGMINCNKKKIANIMLKYM